MINSYLPTKARIISVIQDSEDTKLFRFQFVNKKEQRNFAFIPGQFLQIGLPGWGECPISICSSPQDASSFFELAIRQVGSLTNKLHELKKGDSVDIRGPYGNGFDVELFKDKPLLLIGGGCGLVPLRPLILEYFAGNLSNSILQIYYGCRNQQTLQFKDQHAKWSKEAEFNLILEKPQPGWKGQAGLITDLFKGKTITSNSVAVIVGPPIMYKFVIQELKKRKVADQHILVSLEQKMYCGLGVCQHCALGPYYVCKDGPVFSWEQIKPYYSV